MTPNSANPFDPIHNALNELLTGMQQVLETLKRPSEWEAITVAMATRRKGRRKLLEAVDDGRVRAKRVEARGPTDAWFLNTRDLDEHFPIRNK
mgnify:CR=1 FL=1